MSLSSVDNITSVFRQGSGITCSQGTLLNLLAEVASQKLCIEKDVLKSLPAKPVAYKAKVSSSGICKNKRRTKKSLALKHMNRDINIYCDKPSATSYLNGINKKLQQLPDPVIDNDVGKGDSLAYRMTGSQVRGLSSSQLIKLFSVLEDNEMKRTFYFQCKFLPTCQKRFFSFGSEEKARHLIKRHLEDHIQQLTPDTVIDVPHKYDASIVHRKSSIKSFKKITNCIIKKPESCKILTKKKIKKLTANENEFKNCLIDKHKNNNKVKKLKASAEKITFDTVKHAPEVDRNSSINFDESSDHNYYRYLNITNPDGSIINNVDNKSPIIIDGIANYEYDNNTNNCLLNLNKTDSICASSDYDNKVTDVNITVVPDPYVPSSASAGDNYSYCYYNSELLEKNSDDCTYTQLLPLHSDLVVDYITPVEQEITIETETDVVVSECFSGHQETEEISCSMLNMKDEQVDATKDELNLQVPRESEKKPKGKAKFIGRSAEEREMAIEMIKTLKRDKDNGALECRICRPKRVFTAPTTLISHYRSHAGIKPYECVLCKAMFTRQHSLNYHLLIHQNQTRFTCEVCGRKFRHPSHFKEHQRRHTGESPFHCPDCSHRFKTRNTYKRHLKTRHNKILSHSGAIITVDSNGKTLITSNDIKLKVEEPDLSKDIKLETIDEDNVEITSSENTETETFRNLDVDFNKINTVNNDLDKENNNRCTVNVVSCKSNKGNSVDTSDGVIKNKVITAIAGDASSKNQKGYVNNVNRNAVVLSFVPTLQQPQYKLFKSKSAVGFNSHISSCPSAALHSGNSNSTVTTKSAAMTIVVGNKN